MYQESPGQCPGEGAGGRDDQLDPGMPRPRLPRHEARCPCPGRRPEVREAAGEEAGDHGHDAAA